MLISIIIPIYNSELYLSRCLQSVKCQTYQDIEVLLINNGSSDSCIKICREFSAEDNRFKLFHLNVAGVSVARNFGINKAKGEYITFLDSDDTLECTFIETMLQAAVPANAEIVVCDINYIDSATGVKVSSEIRFDAGIRRFNTCRTFCWGKLYRNILLTGIKFPKFQCFEDVAVVPVLLAKAKRICYVHECLINYYRNRVGSLSGELKYGSCLFDCLQVLEENLVRFNLYEKYKIEFEKMAVSQIRFLFRRFQELSDDLIMIERAEKYLLTLNRQLNKLMAGRFYVLGDELLGLGVDKAVFFPNQVVNDIKKADYIVCYCGCSDVLLPSAKYIPKIGIDLQKTVMNETNYIYNVAEMILSYFIGD